MRAIEAINRRLTVVLGVAEQALEPARTDSTQSVLTVFHQELGAWRRDGRVGDWAAGTLAPVSGALVLRGLESRPLGRRSARARPRRRWRPASRGDGWTGDSSCCWWSPVRAGDADRLAQPSCVAGLDNGVRGHSGPGPALPGPRGLGQRGHHHARSCRHHPVRSPGGPQTASQNLCEESAPRAAAP